MVLWMSGVGVVQTNVYRQHGVYAAGSTCTFALVPLVISHTAAAAAAGVACCCCCCVMQEAEQERARSAASSRKMLNLQPQDLSGGHMDQQPPSATSPGRDGKIKAARPGSIGGGR